MIKNLVIVESPAKAKTIEKFLGKDYVVKSCYGHIRDLEKKDKGVDIDNGFTPNYKIPPEKKEVVKELKKDVKNAETVWLATDEDREGEAIAWHLKEALELPPEKTRRIIFHEITKSAIQNAIKQPRGIDDHLVEAQQARRILDRLVGFEVSPVLWRKVKPSLSAGRVQSVAVRLIVEREREIENFKPGSHFRVQAEFLVEDENGKTETLKAELPKKFKTLKEAKEFLEKCTEADFSVESLEKKPVKKNPAPPFTTSTLQQEASRKLGFSVSRTMRVAQNLYEAGRITYMRTDSVNLSDIALKSSKEVITKDYGEKYSKTRNFKTKDESAQEAHEAIRPTEFNKEKVDGNRDEKALYELIWKRAIASQMSEAQIERTNVKIAISNSDERFTAQGEVIKFDGFLKVYLESTDEENGEKEEKGILPPLYKGQKLDLDKISATERFTRSPARYTEATLVKKLEELGIGRPSTYAPTIDTIQRRGYVVKGEGLAGKERKYKYLYVDENGKIQQEEKTETTGSDKNKLLPADIAKLVNDFLLDKFPQIMDYKFTAEVEKELDNIAQGEIDWRNMLKDFYYPFHERVEETIENSERVSGERVLGKDPKTGKEVSVRMAKYGPVAQKKDPNAPEAKPEFAGLMATQKLDSITLEEALDLFKLPQSLGEYEDEEVVASVGRFGPYVRHKGQFYSLGKNGDPYNITLEEAKEVIEEKRKKDAERTIKIFDEDPDYKIMKGRWGPFLKAGRKNVKIPKDKDPEKLTFEEAKQLLKEKKEKKQSKSKSKKSTSKTKK